MTPPVQGRGDAIANVHRQFSSGEFLQTLARRVAYQTESQSTGRAAELRAYLEKEMRTAFAELDFESRLVESPSGRSPFLVAEHRESDALPTVLIYGHGDVVDGMIGEWRGGLDPWKLTTIGNRVYGRGAADNKGQHSINLAALAAVRDARGGKLGFNAKFLIEMGEEIGSPDLNKVCASLRDELKADLLLASDGPRLAADRPTIFLGCRGGIRIHLDVNLREGGHHSGNWGGLLANPATILANAIASLVDSHGRMKLEALKPPRLTNQVRSMLADVEINPLPEEPALSEDWGEEGLSAAERVYAWNTLEVLAMSSGNIDHPANAIPGHARAVLQLRFVVGTKHEGVVDAVRAHLAASGFPMVEVSATQSFIASRTDFDSPWIKWAADFDPADHRQDAGRAAEFRRLAAERCVLRDAGITYDLGAAFLSGLLPARARRTHPAVGDRGGAGDHGGAVLGFGRNVARGRFEMTVLAPAEGMPQTASEKKNVTRLVVATSLGNALEWFDISVYAFFAVYLSKAFFPANDPTTSLLLTFGSFGLTFLARPVGGVLLGAYADRHGRKASLLLSIAMMTFGTLAVGCMPTFDKIGVWAPLLVIVARLVQGFSAGGEFGSSTAFLVEHMPGRRGFVASWQFASQGISALLGSGFGVLLSSTLTETELQTWGWRIPFLFGVLIGPIGLYIRNKIEDATAPPAAKHDTPVRNVFMAQKFPVLLAVGAIATATAVNYLIIYMPTYVVKTLHLPPLIGYLAAFAAAIAAVTLNPVAGAISDRVGRTPYLITVGVLLLLAIFPLYLLLASKPSGTIIVLAVLLLGSLKALYLGAVAALMSELFPASTRATGLGLSYNIGVTVFGGMGPATVTWLGTFAVIGDLAPGYYLTAVCLFSLWALTAIHRTRANRYA